MTDLESGENIFAWYNSEEADILFQLTVESLTAIRNITIGQHCRLRWIREKDRVKYINAITQVAHNFHPRVPTDVIVSSYYRERERAPEAFEMLPMLESWVRSRQQASMGDVLASIQIGKLVPPHTHDQP